YELRWSSIRALTDVQVDLQEALLLGDRSKSPLMNARKLNWLPDGRIQHSYPFEADTAVRSRFFRLAPVLQPAP
ncbi:MAG: hypothetical protein ACO3JG_06380, partial [Luteolibacter sp.]